MHMSNWEFRTTFDTQLLDMASLVPRRYPVPCHLQFVYVMENWAACIFITDMYFMTTIHFLMQVVRLHLWVLREHTNIQMRLLF